MRVRVKMQRMTKAGQSLGMGRGRGSRRKVLL